MTTDITLENLTIDFEKNSRTVQIKDKNGRVQFLVVFIDLETDIQGMRYLVKVREILDNDVPFDVLRQFYTSEEKTKALQTAQSLVGQYQTLVNSERGEIDPREMFDEGINYRKIDPDCCKNCIFCVYHEIPEENSIEYLCSNKKNIRFGEYLREMQCKYPQTDYIQILEDMITISADHICDNYSSIPQSQR